MDMDNRNIQIFRNILLGCLRYKSFFFLNRVQYRQKRSPFLIILVGDLIQFFYNFRGEHIIYPIRLQSC